MGLRFRKSIKISPGVNLNLNKNSASVSFGSKGAHIQSIQTGKRLCRQACQELVFPMFTQAEGLVEQRNPMPVILTPFQPYHLVRMMIRRLFTKKRGL